LVGSWGYKIFSAVKLVKGWIDNANRIKIFFITKINKCNDNYLVFASNLPSVILWILPSLLSIPVNSKVPAIILLVLSIFVMTTIPVLNESVSAFPKEQYDG
jgi:hypothetical protein